MKRFCIPVIHRVEGYYSFMSSIFLSVRKPRFPDTVIAMATQFSINMCRVGF